MGIEKRKHERKPLRTDRCVGTFTLEVRNEFHEVLEVRDISLSGMGITLPVYMDPGRPVKIFYAEDDHIVSLTGTITWCDEHSLSSSSFKIGIYFDDPYRDEGCAFHAAMSRYLA